MNILIVGAGVIGTIYGWALASGGHRVTHLVRTGRNARYAPGVRLDILDKRRGQPRWFRGSYLLRTVESVQEVSDTELLIVPGHHFALAEVLTNVIPHLPNADILFLTQNWAGTAEIDAIVPRNRYLFGDAKAGGSWEGGLLKGALHSLDIGPVHSEGKLAVECTALALAQAKIPAPVHQNMIAYLWTQFAMTAALWPSLVEAGGFKPLLSDRKAGLKALDAMIECLDLLEKRGLRMVDFPETNLYRSRAPLVRFLALGYLKVAFTASEFMKRTSAHALGDKTEVRAFYFDVLGTAHALDHPMPVFESYRDSIERFTRDELHSAG